MIFPQNPISIRLFEATTGLLAWHLPQDLGRIHRRIRGFPSGIPYEWMVNNGKSWEILFWLVVGSPL